MIDLSKTIPSDSTPVNRSDLKSLNKKLDNIEKSLDKMLKMLQALSEKKSGKNGSSEGTEKKEDTKDERKKRHENLMRKYGVT